MVNAKVANFKGTKFKKATNFVYPIIYGI